MFQQIMLIGNLGNDPEQRFTPTGVPVMSFNLAVNRTWTGQDGQRQDKTTWFRVTTWRKQAEIVSQYLTKGSKVMVIGEIEEARPYTDKKTGTARASLEVTAATVKFLSSRGDAAGDAHDDGGHSSAAEPAANPNGGSFDDDQIPF